MGLTHANIEIINADDIAYLRKGDIGDDEVRKLTIKMLADTGSIMLCINEEISNALGLVKVSRRRSQLANGMMVNLDVVGPVVLRYLDRDCATNAIVLPDDSEPLLGAIPIEEMDLYVHPNRNELLPAHPDGAVMSLKGVKL